MYYDALGLWWREWANPQSEFSPDIERIIGSKIAFGRFLKIKGDWKAKLENGLKVIASEPFDE